MTDNTPFDSAPESPDNAASNDGQDALPQNVSTPETDWEMVSFPGQVTIDEEDGDESQPNPAVISLGMTANSLASGGVEQNNLNPDLNHSPENKNKLENSTKELIQLIQDLNHCNDALLTRVAELEEDLERSQIALQTEVERNQSQTVTAGPVPQQIAQLLSELDIANDGLRRTTIHNERLQGELEANQQRVARLERECTLLQQRFSEKTTALSQAEETCRDVKSRLHRQQRYTLQFKAALEKCLNMASNPHSEPEMSPASLPMNENPALHPVSMPKSRQIQPWSAGGAEATSNNPSLSHLLRSLKAAGQGPQSTATSSSFQPPSNSASSSSSAASSHELNRGNLSPIDLNTIGAFTNPTVLPALSHAEAITDPPTTASAGTAKAIDPEAENRLWQDLERVAEADLSDLSSLTSSPSPGRLFSNPWEEQPTTAVESPEPEKSPEPESSQGILAFTEPSPWGAPLPAPSPPPAAQSQAPATPAPRPTQPVPTIAPIPSPAAPGKISGTISRAPEPSFVTQPEPAPLPAYLQTGHQTSPSPLVYPLRSQKKISSIAAVQLPTFGRPRRRS